MCLPRHARHGAAYIPCSTAEIELANANFLHMNYKKCCSWAHSQALFCFKGRMCNWNRISHTYLSRWKLFSSLLSTAVRNELRNSLSWLTLARCARRYRCGPRSNLEFSLWKKRTRRPTHTYQPQSVFWFLNITYFIRTENICVFFSRKLFYYIFGFSFSQRASSPPHVARARSITLSAFRQFDNIN